MGFVYGYEEEGRSILVRDYHIGNTETVMPIGQTKNLFCFFKQRTATPPRTESIHAGLRQAIVEATAPAIPTRRFDHDGAYYNGEEAYAKWIARLTNAASLTQGQQRKLFFVSWWTFFIVEDARRQAANYLAGSAVYFPESTESIKEAAQYYRQMSAIIEQVRRDEAGFFSPHDGNRFEQWTPEVRQQEIAIIKQLFALDRQAITALKRGVTI
jgi:hypothetical protein